MKTPPRKTGTLDTWAWVWGVGCPLFMLALLMAYRQGFPSLYVGLGLCQRFGPNGMRGATTALLLLEITIFVLLPGLTSAMAKRHYEWWGLAPLAIMISAFLAFTLSQPNGDPITALFIVIVVSSIVWLVSSYPVCCIRNKRQRKTMPPEPPTHSDKDVWPPPPRL